MKRAAAVLLTLALMLSLTACMSRGSMQLKRADRYFDDLRGAFKMSDVTNSARLIGKRENNGRDWFTGSYTAQCENETGRDTVFGGASARDKLIKVKAYIKTESGSAVIRLRMNGKVLEYTPDTDGRFEREFNFQNGGNYIMIDFDRFTGTVQMTAEYV
ncbi:MAG: hypothetical protein UCK97_09580 [Acutalibacteraceae bacterium]|jgi:predicted small lipoprotein YifL|nr:hypothetical protein [Acutalibacteraceae bacterium]HJI69261.1 hypothetical protein [Oscillospiraceae bacterium]